MVDYPQDFGPRRDHMDDALEQRRIRRELILKRVGLTLLSLAVAGVLLTGTLASLSNNETLHRVKSCTDTTGACYKDGQKRTTQAVGSIASNNILAIVCALQVPDGTPMREALQEVTDCVQEHQQRTDGKP